MAIKTQINDKCRDRTRQRTRSENGVFTKATNAERERRVMVLVEEIAQGSSHSDIVQKYSVEWGVSERQVSTYWKRAQESVVEHYQNEKESHASLVFLRLDHLYKKTLEAKDYRIAFAALKEKANIIGAKEQERDARRFRGLDIELKPSGSSYRSGWR